MPQDTAKMEQIAHCLGRMDQTAILAPSHNPEIGVNISKH